MLPDLREQVQNFTKSAQTVTSTRTALFCPVLLWWSYLSYSAICLHLQQNHNKTQTLSHGSPQKALAHESRYTVHPKFCQHSHRFISWSVSLIDRCCMNEHQMKSGKKSLNLGFPGRLCVLSPKKINQLPNVYSLCTIKLHIMYLVKNHCYLLLLFYIYSELNVRKVEKKSGKGFQVRVLNHKHHIVHNKQ